MTLHGDNETARSNPTSESLVAWYGDKPAGFERWLRELGEEVASAIGAEFEPYALARIHATITDLGPAATAGRADAAANKGRPRKMDELARWLRKELREPMKIRFGGLQNDADESLWSRGQPRRQRSFSLQEKLVVLIGWCIDDGRIGQIRRGCEQFGFVHRYHRDPNAATDQDCYLRLGLIADLGAVAHDKDRRARIEESIRASLCAPKRELIVDLGVADLSIVRYDDESLPIDTSQVRKLGGDQAPPGA